MNSEQELLNRRKYLRIPALIPIVISVSNANKENNENKKFQSFTKNISETGLCLEVNELDGEFSRFLSKDNVFHINVEVPFKKEPISSEVILAWDSTKETAHGKRHFVGVSFIDLSDKECKQLFNYAKKIRNRPYVIATVISVLFVLSLLLYYGLYQRTKDLRMKETQLKEIRYKMNEKENRLISINKKYYRVEKNLLKFEKEQKELEKALRHYKPKLAKVHDDAELLSEKIEILSQELDKAKEDEQEAKMKAGDYLVSKWEVENNLRKVLKEKRTLLQELSELKESKLKLKEELLTKIDKTKGSSVYNVVLKNGMIMTGELIKETDVSLKLKVGKGFLNIEKKKIERIRQLSLSSQIELTDKWKKEEKIEQARTESHKDVSLNYQQKLSPIEIKGRRIYYQGKLFFIKGIGYGIEYPGVAGGMKDYKKIPKKVFEEDFKKMAQAGINVIRTYEPLNKRLLDLALKYNIKVVENICYPTGMTDFSSHLHLNVLLEQAIETVYRHKNHKAILMWAIWNDAPWIWAVGGSPFPKQKFNVVNGFMRKIYKEIKRIDPTRPITASNVLGFEGSKLGFDYLDVIGFNEYLGGMDCYIQEDANASIKKLVEISKTYNKPVVIWETGSSTYVEHLKQDTVIYDQIKSIGENIAGITLFQWADGWNKAGSKDIQDFHIEEHWGILTGFRKEKPGFSMVSKLFNKIPTVSKGFKADQLK